MSLRYALLGFLSTTPASGYALGRKFATGAGAMWEALPSQIYPELRRLEKLGWIEGKTSPRDRLRRRVYRVTALGMRELQAWVEADESAHAPQRDAERVRFLFIDRSEFEVIRRHLQRRRAHYQKLLAEWAGQRDAIAHGTQERMRDRLSECPADERAFVTAIKWYAFEGLLRQAQMEIAWTTEILAWLDRVAQKKNVKTLPFAAQQPKPKQSAALKRKRSRSVAARRPLSAKPASTRTV